MNDESKDVKQDITQDNMPDDKPIELTRRDFFKLTLGAYRYFLPFFAGLIALLLVFYVLFRFVL